MGKELLEGEQRCGGSPVEAAHCQHVLPWSAGVCLSSPMAGVRLTEPLPLLLLKRLL